ncbi:uncharacterized protein DS421_10g310070 [Arachis hypogaea]|nr:uncharacterized protein DS421_10g310070 [Arachis hypogaea]
MNARLHDPIFPPIYDACLQYGIGEDYKTQVVCDNSIQSETIEDIITDLISPNRCYSDVENGGFVFILGTISSVSRIISGGSQLVYVVLLCQLINKFYHVIYVSFNALMLSQDSA